MSVRRRRWRAALAVAVVAALVLALVAWRAGEWLRGEVERRLQAQFVPTVTLAGPVSFSLLPRPSLALRGLLLSGADGARLLAVERTTVETSLDDFLAPTPTLTAVRLDGVAAELVRGGDGRWNAAGWLRSSEGGGGVLPLRLGALVVDDARLRIDDAVAGVTAELQALHLEAAPLAWDEAATVRLRTRVALAAPRTATAELQAEGQLRTGPAGTVLEGLSIELAGAGDAWDLERGTVGVDRAAVTAEGVRGKRMRAELRMGTPGGRGAAYLALDDVAVSGGRLRAERLSLKVEAESGEAAATGTLTAPMFDLDGASWHLATGDVELYAALPGRGQMTARLPFEAEGEGATGQGRFGPGRIGLPHPGDVRRSVAVLAQGELRFGGELIAGRFAGSFDDSRIAANWRYRPAAAVPLEVEATLDRLDADRYLPPPSATDAPIDFDAWRDLPVRGEVKVGRLRYREVEVRNVRLRLAG